MNIDAAVVEKAADAAALAEQATVPDGAEKAMQPDVEVVCSSFDRFDRFMGAVRFGCVVSGANRLAVR